MEEEMSASALPKRVMDLRSESVVLHLSPADGDYAEVGEYGRDQVFASPALGGRAVRVNVLLVHRAGGDR